jgi:hypothetical protein
MKQALRTKGLACASAVALSTLVFAPAVSAAGQQQTRVYHANLTSLNKSGTTGTATVKVMGDKATVKIDSTGASAGLRHAQHIHIGGKNVCPTKKADKNNDGVVSTVEGKPAYGGIKVSLTTKGKTGHKSALAVKRFPSASKKGAISYSRTFTLPKGVSASDIGKGVIVQHGVASLSGKKSKYDGKAKSQLDKSLPLEVTAPADCGKLVAAPKGGASTGGGATAGIEDPALFAIGGTAIVAAGVALGFRARSLAAQRR